MCDDLIYLFFDQKSADRRILICSMCQGTNVIVETCWSHLSRLSKCSVPTKSPPPPVAPAENLRSTLAAPRLTFCAIWRIGERTIGWISQVIVLLPQK